MAATGKSKTCVWRWQERFMAQGVDGLLRDKTRPPGIAPLEATLIDKVVALTLEPPSHEATHWTVRAMAKGDCQDFRVWPGIMGNKESHYVTTQRTCHTE
jgi:hypothetical protein